MMVKHVNDKSNMRILVVGAGLSGATIARLLTDAGYSVSMIEKKGFPGGLCITRVNRDGLKYEPFGARTFHTNKEHVKEFVTRFDKFNGYTHYKGVIIDSMLFPFPMTKEALNDLPDNDQILEELANRPKAVDKTNFETAAISIVGKTLYRYFIENYSKKMWGCEPRDLTADWAPKRLEFREDGRTECFLNQWQGLPVNGYSYLIKKMIDEIPVKYRTSHYNQNDYDLVISTAPIDLLFEYKYGRLQYRSMRYTYVRDEHWEKDTYGTINLPQHPKYIRKCNFKVLYKADSPHNWIQYQEPLAADDKLMPMYPVNTKENDAIFDQYLKEICATNICPLGRLGLFKYLDMDKAVLHAFEMLPVVVEYLSLNPEARYQKIKEIIKRF